VNSRTTGANEARTRHTEALLTRIREALAELRRERATVTVRAVERRAGVSRSFLYQNADAKALIAEATANSDSLRAAGRRQASDAIDAAWRERALNAEDALKKTTAEVSAQRRQIAELMGRVRDLEADLPADAVQRLASANTDLKKQLRTLEAENRTLAERLGASRANNCSQDTRIAGLQAQLLEHVGPAAERHLHAVAPLRD